MQSVESARLSAIQCVMDRVLEADPTVAITRSVQPRQHLQLDLLVTAHLTDDVGLEGVQDALEDGTDYCRNS
jgi:hypothetical protein